MQYYFRRSQYKSKISASAANHTGYEADKNENTAIVFIGEKRVVVHRAINFGIETNVK